MERVGNVLLNLECYDGEDFYSDGEIEDELLDIVKKFKTEQFNNIIFKSQNWPLLYHLHENRGNIIDWIPFTQKDKVLEIGSGCGAITTKLSELAGSVDCVELSKKRSLINAYRNSEKDNINIHVGNYQRIKCELKNNYDYVTLIGVLEYAESYYNCDTPYLEMLTEAGKHLNDTGKLIIAIENKFGLKYWAGCKEDHLGKYFEGIMGYPTTNSVRTFSKIQLETLLNDAGYSKMKFYYPYPDYKLPNAIYSDEYLPGINTLTANFLNFDMDRIQLFNETLAFNEIINDGLFPIYSNSYLIIAEKDK